MVNEIPDYSNIQFSLSDMNRFLKDSNFTLSEADSKKLNTIFGKYDKVNEKGENKPDGILSKNENREKFLKDLDKEMPELSNKLLEFFIILDIVEEDRELKKVKEPNKGFDTKI